jgi:hypothetical protein
MVDAPTKKSSIDRPLVALYPNFPARMYDADGPTFQPPSPQIPHNTCLATVVWTDRFLCEFIKEFYTARFFPTVLLIGFNSLTNQIKSCRKT